MIEFSETEAQLNPEQLKEVEQIIGFNLPKEYKEHLLKYNGGRCNPNVFSFAENGTLSQSSVDWFLALYNGEYDNLLKYIAIFKLEGNRLPSRMLPIAHDAGGNLICISCDGTDLGSVYFWDHEKEAKDDDHKSDSNLYLISNSFNEFILGLKSASEI